MPGTEVLATLAAGPATAVEKMKSCKKSSCKGEQLQQPMAEERGERRVDTADTKINAWKVGQVSKSLKCEYYAKLKESIAKAKPARRTEQKWTKGTRHTQRDSQK